MSSIDSIAGALAALWIPSGSTLVSSATILPSQIFSISAMLVDAGVAEILSGSSN